MLSIDMLYMLKESILNNPLDNLRCYKYFIQTTKHVENK